MADDDQQWKIAEVPPIVQELAAGVQEPPSRYVLPEQARPSAPVSDMPAPIPIVDLSRLSDADEAAKLRSALQNWGLFLAVGHGMEPGFLAEVKRVTRGFYELPPEEKKKYSNLVNGKEFRLEGYGSDMVVSEKQILDWCDRFYLVVEPESRRIYSLWPTQLPSFRVLQGCPVRVHGQVQGDHHGRPQEPGQAARPARGLLRRHARRGGRDVRQADLLPPLPQARPRPRPEAPLRRLRAHRPPRRRHRHRAAGAERRRRVIMSNGLLKSPVHRVVTNAERERVSVAMFYSMDMEKEIEPAPELVDESREEAKAVREDEDQGLRSRDLTSLCKWDASH